MLFKSGRLHGVSIALGITVSTFALHAQEISSQPGNDESPSAISASQPPTPEQMPPNPPHISCDDGLLKIDASNSTLAAVLEAVRACTGTEMDVPESAAKQRLFASLGPGPVRQVLASLLSSTDFNYLIQSSDSDPQKVRTVLLMARTTGDSATTAAAGTTSQRAGWTKARRNVVESASSPAEESSPAPNPVEMPAVSPVETATTEAGTATQEIAVSNALSSSLETAPVTAAVASQSGIAPTQSNATQQLIQDMRRMFEERRQMQQQQQRSTPK